MGSATYQDKKEQLLALMRERKFSGNKLPTEENLTQILSCSRGTLREILRELEHAGYITKKHSIGNFIHPSALGMKGRVGYYPRFIQMIQGAGRKSRVELLDAKKYGCDEHPHLWMHKTHPDFFADVDYSIHLYYADDIPAICCDCYVPRSIIIEESALSDRHIPLFDYLEKYCNQQIEQVGIRYHIREADERIADLLKVEQGTPLMVWEESYYNFCDEIICVSYNYFNSDVVPLSMLRRYEP